MSSHSWSICLIVLTICTTGLIADDGDSSDSEESFVWSGVKATNSPAAGPKVRATVISSGRQFPNPRSRGQVVRVLQMPTDEDGQTQPSTPDKQPKNRSMIDDLFAGLLAGGQTSLENNVLSIQSSNTHLTHNDGRGPFIAGPVDGPGLGGPPPPPPNGGGFGNGFNNGGFQQQLPPPGQFAPQPLPPPIPNNCECLNIADCHDVAGFARQIRRMRQDFCAIGSVLCCSDPRPGSGGPPPPPPGRPPFRPQAQPVIVAPQGPPLIGGSRPGPPPPPQCGRKGGNPLARTLDVGNPRDVAEFGEYPWMAAILRLDLTYVCGAVLIDVNVVLTAAHCVAKLKGEDIIVRLGEYDVGEQQELPFQDVHVRSVVINGGYHSGTLRNDIAILLLDGPARLSSYIRPVCLPPPQDMSGLICTVTGWGKNRPRGHFSPILKEVDLPVIDNGKCEALYRGSAELGPVFNLHPSMLCAGLPGKDACSGDGGSPLVCNVDGAWRLAGLVSWGIGCGQYPGVYTRVQSFVPWINDVMSRG
ncbi:putative Serine proteinase stubble [Hypsibius exemplaris]|uniref:Serine proteinase stubble n=1 Tax=Hypsibius exemplaris TaxID=2072580 RepID=A0A1W0X894_HYPEX|nr:putative Serine proteinase stubble [Hypsibius exemplaris]